MAVNCYEATCENNNSPKSSCSSNSSKGGSLQPCRLVKINFATDECITGSPNKRSKVKKCKDPKSPYLAGDKVQLLTRITEKRLIQKKGTGMLSSFPLAVNLYKASSDEFKSLKKINKKVKKSVLTLPNEPAPMPQACTVSDINDSEYFERNYESRVKKRLPVQNNKKPRGRQHKDLEFYDRDARYCSEMNIDLDCSSTDLLKPYEGGNSTVTKNTSLSSKDRPGEAVNAHDVWAVLRNINRFQFRPSPPMSDDSIRSPKKKKQVPKKRFKRRDARIIETCRTEEFAYISRFDLDSKSPSFSPSSSFDRITVIDQQDEFSKICKQFQKKLAKSHTNKDNVRPAKQVKSVTQKRISPKNNTKAIKIKENNKLIHSEPIDQTPRKPNADAGKHDEATIKHEGQFKKSSTSSFELHCIEPRVDCLPKTPNIRIIDSKKKIARKTSSPKSPVNCYEDLHDNFVYSGNSGTSKEGNGDILLPKENGANDEPIEDSNEVSIPKRCKEVVLNKELNVVMKKRNDPVQRKSHTLTTSPVIVLKLTQADIRRRLATLKFPIVVLGREQVSSHVPVMDGETPQFDGLDKHIWPFMVDWKPRCKKSENNKADFRGITANIQKKKSNCPPIDSEKLRKIHNENVLLNKQTRLQDKKQVCNIDMTNKKKLELKKPVPVVGNSVVGCNNKLQHEKKPKSIRHFKDRVIQMLYKKSSSQNFEEKYPDSEQGDIKTIKAPNGSRRKVDAFTETNVLSNTFAREILNPLVINSNNKLSNNKVLAIKYPWSKGKSASDFIETVIRKIVNGVYYNHDHRQCQDFREASIQTSVSTNSDLSTAIQQLDILNPPVSLDPLSAIPGFDNTMPDLEIKTLNLSQIAVKHCVTNIMLQFDVKVPPGPSIGKINVKSSSSVIPLEVMDSQTKIFKCKTTILNAMLPAELCSLLPKMLHSIMENDIKIGSPPTLNKTESHLSTITEITLCENLDVFSPLVFMTLELQHLVKGVFSNATTNPAVNCSARRSMMPFITNRCTIMNLLPKLSRKHLFNYEANILPLIVCPNQVTEQRSPKRSGIQLQPSLPAMACTALVPYTKKLLQLVKPGIIDTFNSDFNFEKTNGIPILIKPLLIKCYPNNMQFNLVTLNSRGFNTEMSVTLKNMKMDSAYSWLPKSTSENKIKAIKGYGNCSEKSTAHVSNGLTTDKNNNPNKMHTIKGKIRRKGFVKLFRKCRSTTNIVCEKSTSLSKITNLDDFLQVFGSSKQLFSIFDESAARKILSCIIEMKAWISEISARQALLVLLLLNKKDTPHLTRFRPILLQGIAVNRITRSHELDMEIEVIERENIKFSQASDYQKPFDETSERLLKSLLQKRKMLNPSYLRVMARYVGLGLLKSPKEN